MSAADARKRVIREANDLLALETNPEIQIHARFERFAKWYDRAYALLEEKQLLNHEAYPTPQQLRNEWQELFAAADTATVIKGFQAQRLVSILGDPKSFSYSFDTNSFHGVPAESIGVLKTLQRARMMYQHFEYLSDAATCPVNCNKGEFKALLLATGDKNDLTALDLYHLERNAEIAAAALRISSKILTMEENERGTGRG